jgi:molybdopterin/thiamine biosynthesis adenylyltransferase
MRYEKNGIFTQTQMKELKSKRVCIVGCGGLGGYILEMFSRVGVGFITVIDGDVFDESNLNRQLLSDEKSIGLPKVSAAIRRIHTVNSEVELTAHQVFLSEENAQSLVEKHDLVIDALDSIDARRVLQKTCEALNIPFVHGAIAGWYGQVTTIFPGDRTLDLLYPKDAQRGVESELGNPSFTPATIASIQVSEGLKVLTGSKDLLRNKVLHIDLLRNSFDVVDYKI